MSEPVHSPLRHQIQQQFHSIVYFTDSLERAKLLSELLYFDGIQLEVISDERFLSPVFRKNAPKLVLFDHEILREETLRHVYEARKICGPSLLIVPMIEAETLQEQKVDGVSIEELDIDAYIHPSCDFEAIHCTVRRLLSHKYVRGKRREPRLNVDSEVPFSAFTNEGVLELKPSNLNMGGAQLELDASEIHFFRKDQLIKLHARFPESTGMPRNSILIHAITRWVSSHTLGVEFYDYNRGSLKSLIELTKIDSK